MRRIMCSIIITTLFLIMSCSEFMGMLGGGNEKPVVSIEVSTTSAAIGTEIDFTANANDPDGIIDRYYWEFGDGEIQEGENVAYSYTEAGTYTVTLTVTDNDGATANTTQSIEITDNSDQTGLTADFTWTPEEPLEGERIEFANLSTHSENDELTYSWDMENDGTEEYTDENPSHVFESAGEYEVVLTATDTVGNIDTATYPITVFENTTGRPIADFSWTPTNPVEGETVSFTNESTDPESEELTFSWDIDGDGTEDYSDTDPSHTYSAAGEYDVTLTATDTAENTDTATYTLTVTTGTTNNAPTADFFWTPTNPVEGDTVYFTESASDNDGTVETWEWEFGDGNTATGNMVENTYTVSGSYQVKLVVTDDKGATDEVVYTITVEAQTSTQSVLVAGSVDHSSAGSGWDIYVARYSAADYSLEDSTVIDFDFKLMDDHATSIDVDEEGNIYVGGYTGDDSDNLTRDAFVLKLDSNLDEVDSTQFAGNGGATASRQDQVYDVLIVNSYLYIGGRTNRAGVDGDRMMLRSDLDFTNVINANWDPGSNDNAICQTLSADSVGNIYAGGLTDQGSWSWELSLRGSDLSVTQSDIHSAQNGYPINSAVDASDNVYYIGYGNSGDNNWYIMKYDTSFSLVSDFGSSGIVSMDIGDDDRARAAAIDEENNTILVVGNGQNNYQGWYLYNVNMTTGTNNELYSYISTNGDSYPLDLVFSENSEIFIVGRQPSSNGSGRQARLAVLDTAGQELHVDLVSENLFPESEFSAAVLD
ncbi:MAG: PKD domain-containing protein [Spirochaetia bacterium]